MQQTANVSLKKIRLALWVLVVATVGAILLFVLRTPAPSAVAFGGPFELQSTRGGTFSNHDLEGTPSLVLFGFTFCPDVCPMTLVNAASWRQSLELNESDVRIIFASVDPRRDTLEVMEEYVSAFGTPIIGLTGTLDQVEKAKLAFGVFSQEVSQNENISNSSQAGSHAGNHAADAEQLGYDVDHTASVLMFDRAGEFMGTIALGENRDTALAKIQRLTSS